MDPQLPKKRGTDPADESRLLQRAQIDPRSNTEYPPTRVLFIRGLSPSVHERDIVELCSQVGVVTQLFVLHNKGQAFVEFDSQEAADFCLFHFSMKPSFLEGSRLYFSYSGRKQITRKPHEPPVPNPELLLTITQVRFPVTNEVLAKITQPYGRLLRSRIFPRGPGYQCVVEMDCVDSSVAARAGLDGQQIYSGCNLIKAEYSPMPLLVQHQPEPANEEEFSNVVFLHAMGEGAMPEMLFNLFSIYGNVVKVKIFFKRRDMGLVQFEDHQQAVNAKTNLDNIPFLGSNLLVSISRNSFINMPASEKKAAFCRDYANSPFHRYKIAGSKNFQNMFPPSNILHVSNLSDQMNEHFFRQLFARHASVVGFKYIGEGRRMALVKCKDIADAVNVLVHHHNENINGRLLKIAFSKATF